MRLPLQGLSRHPRTKMSPYCLLFRFFSLVVLICGEFGASAEISKVCNDSLANVVNCLGATSSADGKQPASPSDIIQRCSSLSSMAQCSSSVPAECRTSLKELANMFDLAKKLSKGCSSASGHQLMLDLAECNQKNKQNFETCFNFTAIDEALSFDGSAGDSVNFTAFCCVIQNGNKCYAPTAGSKCGEKGTKALSGVVQFLLGAMDCKAAAC